MYNWIAKESSSSCQPTKRALDGWDNIGDSRLRCGRCSLEARSPDAAFSGFFYTRTESCSRSFIHARLVVEPVETHPQVTQTVGRFFAKRFRIEVEEKIEERITRFLG